MSAKSQALDLIDSSVKSESEASEKRVRTAKIAAQGLFAADRECSKRIDRMIAEVKASR